jgi:bacillopeptidase F (M6 metalloprotease family)
VQISTNNGTTWIALEGEFTEPGVGSFQPNGEPLYDGSKANWVKEEINLNSYISSQFKIRFRLRTDSGTTFDGWYVDDIGVLYNPNDVGQ